MAPRIHPGVDSPTATARPITTMAMPETLKDHPVKATTGSPRHAKNNNTSSNSDYMKSTYSVMNQSYEERWSDANVQQTVGDWKLTPEEQDQLRLLQHALLDLKDNWKNNPLDVVRYLRGPGKFEEVEDKFRVMLEWRKEARADELLETYRPPSKLLLWYIPSAILQGVDKDGDPIYLERGGVMDGVGLQQFPREQVIEHVTWLREIGTRGEWIDDFTASRGGKPINQCTILYDMHGMSLRHLKAGVLPMFRDIVKINQQRYCGLAKRIILLRAPSIFQMIWNIAKHFFPPEGQKLMVFTGPNNYQQVLDKYIDREVLPPCICPKEGKGKALDCMPRNYEGGIIPTKGGVEAEIPNEPWIEEFMNYPEYMAKRRQAKDKSNNSNNLNIHIPQNNQNTKNNDKENEGPSSTTAPSSPRQTMTSLISPTRLPARASPANNHNQPIKRPTSPLGQQHMQLPPTLCLSEHHNVKIMTVPPRFGWWSNVDEFETVLVH